MPVIAEVLLVAATWRHAYTFKLASDAHAHVPLTTVLVRDGQHDTGNSIDCTALILTDRDLAFHVSARDARFGQHHDPYSYIQHDPCSTDCERNTPGDYRSCQYLHLFERYPHYYCFARRPLKDI